MSVMELNTNASSSAGAVWMLTCVVVVGRGETLRFLSSAGESVEDAAIECFEVLLWPSGWDFDDKCCTCFKFVLLLVAF